MTNESQLTKLERELLSEFEGDAQLRDQTIWVHSSRVVDYILRALELGGDVCGVDGARLREDEVWPDLELIFDGNPLEDEAALPVEDVLYFDVVLR